MMLLKKASSKNKMNWFCEGKCNSGISVLNNSIFKGIHLTIEKVAKFFLCGLMNIVVNK
jgi:hypothetical protein